MLLQILFTWLDYFLLILFTWACIKGFMRGFVVEVASLFAFVLGIFIAVKFTQVCTDIVSKFIKTDSTLLPFLVFALITILIVAGIHLGARLITHLLESVMMGPFNKIAGALFGIARSVFVMSVLLYFISAFYITSPLMAEQEKKSKVYVYIKDLGPRFLPLEKWTSSFKDALSPLSPLPPEAQHLPCIQEEPLHQLKHSSPGLQG